MAGHLARPPDMVRLTMNHFAAYLGFILGFVIIFLAPIFSFFLWQWSWFGVLLCLGVTILGVSAIFFEDIGDNADDQF